MKNFINAIVEAIGTVLDESEQRFTRIVAFYCLA